MKHYKALNRIFKGLTPEQREQISAWEAKLCGDQTVDQEYSRLLHILENRKTALRELGKESLEECFFTNKSNQDKDLKFGQNFFSRKAASLTEAQKEELARREADICGNSVALRSAVNKDYSHLLEILENRKTELQQLGKESLEECFFTNKSNQGKDLKFGQNFFSRKAASLTEAQKEELARWEADICGNSVALRSAVNKDYSHLLEILENRKTELQQLGKESLEECFFTNKSNQDKDLKFGRNFFSRKAASLSEAQNTCKLGSRYLWRQCGVAVRCQ